MSPTRFVFVSFIAFMGGLLAASAAVPPTQERIVGGMDVPPGEFVPYQVSLQFETKSRGKMHYCGGSILTPTHVLTAAHCCAGFNVSRMSVVGGLRDLKSDTEGQRVEVESYSIHEAYEELTTSDIAILTLREPLLLDGQRMAAINVNGSQFVGGGVPVTLTGWGLRLPVAVPFIDGTEWETINYPYILQTMSYYTLNNELCQWDFPDVTVTEICAYGFLKSACSGDSGGPLVMQTGDGLQQVGIVSYGIRVCGGFGVPDVYTRVSTFSDWIAQRTGA